MQSNWSLIINVLLLVGVIYAIGRIMKARRRSLSFAAYQPHADDAAIPSYSDDIIAVRKLNTDASVDEEAPVLSASTQRQAQPRIWNEDAEDDSLHALIEEEDDFKPAVEVAKAPATLMLFLVAKENRQFVGYELLQTVLAAGLRFGEGNLFYRHQFSNGQGPILCGLAAATATGVFDMQNIGVFSVRGLCLFMHVSHNPTIDADRFAIMLETGKQLSEGLDADLLDEQRRPLTEERIARYYQQLNATPEIA